ncbi:hypothetical protein F8M41_001783 [Gigaspora margarita]|uniref:Uncharacterized protein n=1 Tax=Gigaspora margarita TaxID=4874 RepID=A0A8H4A8S3_GIGMA|nr:hypothetical protein F8M41_001783 [Gigaspora margarita]
MKLNFLKHKRSKFLKYKQTKSYNPNSYTQVIEVPIVQATKISIAQAMQTSTAQQQKFIAIQVLPQVQNSNKVRTSRLLKLKPHTQTHFYSSVMAPFKPPYTPIL